MKSGTLYLVPNLLGVAAPSDVLPERTITIARRLQHFVVETPKIARGFLKTLSPERTIADIAIIACEPAAPALAQCAAWLHEGHGVGVLSDAGCPGMADPGARFVTLAHGLGAPVVPLVGPSSVLLGLMASGFDGQHFTFHGYLPSKPAQRDEALRQLDRQVHHHGVTQIFIETPYRNGALLDALGKTLDGDTMLCVAQNLTGDDERILCLPAGRWTSAARQRFQGKAPTLFLIGRAQRGD